MYRIGRAPTLCGLSEAPMPATERGASAASSVEGFLIMRGAMIATRRSTPRVRCETAVREENEDARWQGDRRDRRGRRHRPRFRPRHGGGGRDGRGARYWRLGFG